MFWLLFAVLIFLIRISVTILILFFLDYLGNLFTVLFPEYDSEYLGTSFGIFLDLYSLDFNYFRIIKFWFNKLD